MSNRISDLVKWLDQVDHFSDKLKAQINRLIGFEDPLMLLPFFGYGTANQLFISGRVLEDEGLLPAEEADTLLEKLVNTFKRFETDEVAGARVLAQFQGVSQEALTDDEGYFELTLTPAQPLPDRLWHEVTLELLEPQPQQGQPVRAATHVLTPPSTASFGVISDIDDTIIQTHVTDKLKLMLTIALHNERTRLPFQGVAAFYQALQQGVDGQANNPIFYVSSSPWNLYDLLAQFFKIHHLPMGPIFLKDYGLHSLLELTDHHRHKLSKIEPLFRLYPHLPFVLIGDSGEQDPEIYAEVVQKYPSRVPTIYIRNVTPDLARLAKLKMLAIKVQQLGSRLALVADSAVAAQAAIEQGLIAPAALAAVQADQAAGDQLPEPADLE